MFAALIDIHNSKLNGAEKLDALSHTRGDNPLLQIAMSIPVAGAARMSSVMDKHTTIFIGLHRSIESADFFLSTILLLDWIYLGEIHVAAAKSNSFETLATSFGTGKRHVADRIHHWLMNQRWYPTYRCKIPTLGC